MSEPFLSEIMLVGFNFAPRGWALCDGQILPINQNQSLFSLLGTTFGGDGRTSFALPDLRGRTPIGFNSAHPLGQRSGVETVALTAAQIPSHTHNVKGTSNPPGAGPLRDPTGAYPATGTALNAYAYHPRSGGTIVDFASGAVQNAGGGQGHNNMQPYQVINFCIALQGLFPSRS